MPVRVGIDSTGPYYQWGDQKKYYFLKGSPSSRKRAREKAERQGAAIERKSGSKLVSVPPSLIIDLSADRVSITRLRNLDSWFRRRPEDQHTSRGGARVRKWVRSALRANDPDFLQRESIQ